MQKYHIKTTIKGGTGAGAQLRRDVMETAPERAAEHIIYRVIYKRMSSPKSCFQLSWQSFPCTVSRKNHVQSLRRLLHHLQLLVFFSYLIRDLRYFTKPALDKKKKIKQ